MSNKLLNHAPKNAVINGRAMKYECWEVRYSRLFDLYGRDTVCITSYVSLPMNYHLLTISYHKDISEFVRSLYDLEHIIYSCFFIPADRTGSIAIIKDMQDAHPDLKLL